MRAFIRRGITMCDAPMVVAANKIATTMNIRTGMYSRIRVALSAPASGRR